ncbi:MAG TPA: zf-HC2 domain-containing protein [Solirubrobacteraceae bacterium]
MRLSYRVRLARDHHWAPGHMSEYVDGELVAGDRARMERHVRECPECDRVLTGLRALVRRLGGLPAPEGGVDAVRVAALVRARLDEPSS